MLGPTYVKNVHMIGWTKASLTKFRCSTEVDNLIDACIDRKKIGRKLHNDTFFLPNEAAFQL